MPLSFGSSRDPERPSLAGLGRVLAGWDGRLEVRDVADGVRSYVHRVQSGQRDGEQQSDRRHRSQQSQPESRPMRGPSYLVAMFNDQRGRGWTTGARLSSESAGSPAAR